MRCSQNFSLVVLAEQDVEEGVAGWGPAYFFEVFLLSTKSTRLFTV